IYLLFLLPLLFIGCKTIQKATTYDFPDPIDTTTKPIDFQEKKQYGSAAMGVYADNRFDGARLNNFEQVNDSTFKATILPENEPINRSPWYAFKLWSDAPKNVQLVLDYEDIKHRYHPKVSTDGETWTWLEDEKISFNEDTTAANLQLGLSSDTLWLAAQEIQNSHHVRQWCKEKAKHPAVNFEAIGKSKQGRDLYYLNMGTGTPKGKEIVVVMGRQHPPEVTGYFAMRAFIDRLLEEDEMTKKFLERYQIMVFPLVNPDGVDLGHWRHSVGGIDLNRDWAYYRQPEIRQMVDFIARTASKQKSQVLLGLDFHSTYYDVYYTLSKDLKSVIPEFKDKWLEGIKTSLAAHNYEINDKPSGLTRPISKGWFYTQFKAEGVTYEIGDDTPRDFIEEKGGVSAEEMMKLLLER
ncbi:MAG: M14 family metallopeptidase, partial [Chitinophagales bacterium]